MFGCQASTFRGMLQKTDFTPADCDEYIKLTNSEQLYNDIVAHAQDEEMRKVLDESGEGAANHAYSDRIYEMRPDVECKYLAAATVMRENFLKGYPGLKKRIDREHKFAIKHFYTRMWYGAVRWAPELAYMTIDPVTNKLKKGSVDAKTSNFLFSHLMNNAANAAVQSGETVFIYSGWIVADMYMRKWHLKSRIYNTIHDSLDCYLYKPEHELVTALINTCVGGKIRWPFEGVHHRMDPEVSDIRDYKHLTGYEEGEFDGSQKILGHFYKHGEEEGTIPIEEAIAKYNKRTGRNIQWEGIPL